MYCDSGMIFTYQGKYETGERTQGGYSTAIRCHENFVFKIPDALSSVHAAPLMCAGLTVYSPLKRNGCGPGKKVGIVGIGGLGHLAVQFAKAYVHLLPFAASITPPAGRLTPSLTTAWAPRSTPSLTRRRRRTTSSPWALRT